MGGTDDPSNLIELTIAEHAEAHLQLFLQHGKAEDYLAWRGLLGCVGKEEFLLERSRIGGMNNTGTKSNVHRRKISESNKLARPKGSPQVGGVRNHTDETKKKIASKMVGHRNSKNHSTEEYRNKQSQAMKDAWARRKQRSVG